MAQKNSEIEVGFIIYDLHVLDRCSVLQSCIGESSTTLNASEIHIMCADCILGKNLKKDVNEPSTSCIPIACTQVWNNILTSCDRLLEMSDSLQGSPVADLA